MNRYVIAIWHGEGDSIAYVIDTTHDEIDTWFSIKQHGSNWQALAIDYVACVSAERVLHDGILNVRHPQDSEHE